MESCIFCRIAAGEVRAAIVHESPATIAFLDTFPAARGHTMIVPRVHAPTLLDLDDRAVGELFRVVKEIMRKIRDGLRPTGMNVGWNHGRAAGQHVPHLHVHVIPRYGQLGRGVQALGDGFEGGDPAEIAALIRAA